MRKITKESVSAFLNNRPFRSGNTTVEMHGNCPHLKLHGNTIARKEIATGKVEITTAQWNTRTTRDRLNGLPGISVYTYKSDLFLDGRPWDGNWVCIGAPRAI